MPSSIKEKKENYDIYYKERKKKKVLQVRGKVKKRK
jgi:hypothetical protein